MLRKKADEHKGREKENGKNGGRAIARVSIFRSSQTAGDSSGGSHNMSCYAMLLPCLVMPYRARCELNTAPPTSSLSPPPSPAKIDRTPRQPSQQQKEQNERKQENDKMRSYTHISRRVSTAAPTPPTPQPPPPPPPLGNGWATCDQIFRGVEIGGGGAGEGQWLFIRRPCHALSCHAIATLQPLPPHGPLSAPPPKSVACCVNFSNSQK